MSESDRDKEADLGARLIDMARKRIAWEGASVRPSRAPGLRLSSALIIRSEARALGIWPE